MPEFTLSQAQADMRHGYLGGAPGVLVSGLVWLVAAALCVAGLVLALARMPVVVGAFTGAAIELALAGVVWAQARRREPSPLST